VLGEARIDATTWIACACDCQRTLESMGFFDVTGRPPTEAVPTPAERGAPSDREPGSAAAR
jgi:hypothetical protein